VTRSRADGYIAGVLQRTALISGFVVSLPALVAGVDGQGTPSIFAPASTPAFAIRELALYALGAPLSPLASPAPQSRDLGHPEAVETALKLLARYPLKLGIRKFCSACTIASPSLSPSAISLGQSIWLLEIMLRSVLMSARMVPPGSQSWPNSWAKFVLK
jgi:hypothetical protein